MGHPHSSVTVLLNGTALGSVAPDAFWARCFDTRGTYLSGGTYPTALLAGEVPGATSASSQAFSFTVDKTTPNPPVVLGISDDDSASASDGITGSHGMIISASSETGATVTISSDLENVFGAGVVGGDARIREQDRRIRKKSRRDCERYLPCSRLQRTHSRTTQNSR